MLIIVEREMIVGNFVLNGAFREPSEFISNISTD